MIQKIIQRLFAEERPVGWYICNASELQQKFEDKKWIQFVEAPKIESDWTWRIQHIVSYSEKIAKIKNNKRYDLKRHRVNTEIRNPAYQNIYQSQYQND